MIPEPVWAAPVLVVIQLADAALCAIPLRFVTECLDDVQLPHRSGQQLAGPRLPATLCTTAMLTDTDRAVLESIAGSARWKA